MNLNGEETYVTTVFDLILANYGVNRGIGEQQAVSYDDPEPFTPALAGTNDRNQKRSCR